MHEKNVAFLKALIQKENSADFLKLAKRVPQGFAEWAYEWRNGYWDQKRSDQVEPTIEKLFLKITNFFTEEPKNWIPLIRLVSLLLGQSPDAFKTVLWSKNFHSFLKLSIQSHTYQSYPAVILARYADPVFREDLVPVVIDYADCAGCSQNDGQMDWAMTGEACETLAYLQALPEASIACLGRHLNDGGCDFMPTVNILLALPYFKAYADQIGPDVQKFVRNICDHDGGEQMMCFRQLSYFVTTKSLAKLLLPELEAYIKDLEFADEIEDWKFYNENNETYFTQMVFQFYGQLQALNRNLV